MQAVKQIGTTPAHTGRMNLANIKRGRINKPPQILMFGVEKIGKSTWAAGAPNPVFIGEDGTSELDVARFPQPASWTDVLEAIEELTSSPHDFKTVVIDPLDWLEPLLWAYICKRDGKKDIDAYGFDKGPKAALIEWRVLLARLDALREKRGMMVIMLAHSVVKTFKNPTGDDFDRYQLSLDAKAGVLIRGWVDAILFAQHETYAVVGEKQTRARGLDSGARVVHTQRRAAWDAGNRYDLPEKLPLSWDDFDSARTDAAANIAKLRDQIKTLLSQVDADTRSKTEGWLTSNPDATSRKLDELLGKLRGRIQIQAEETETNNEITKEVTQ